METGVQEPSDFHEATRRRDRTLRKGAISTYRMTFFPFTSSDLVYPGNPPFNRLYLQAHIRINVPEDLRIKVGLERRLQLAILSGSDPENENRVANSRCLLQRMSF